MRPIAFDEMNAWLEFTPLHAIQIHPTGIALSPFVIPTLQRVDLINFEHSNEIFNKIEEALFEYIDIHFGIVTRKIQSDYFENGYAYIRNATRATVFSERHFDLEHPDIHLANLLLRVLGTIRGIDHVLQYYHVFPKLRTALRAIFLELVTSSCQLQTDSSLFTEKNITRLNLPLNHALVDILHLAQLDLGLSEKKAQTQMGELLDFYRYLAGTLIAKPALVTLHAVEHLIFAEISHPITKKLDRQKTLFSSAFSPNLAEKNFFTALPMAFQNALKAFQSPICQNHSALSAQLRRYIPMGIKNGFLVNFIAIHPATQKIIYNHHFLRCGSPVFVGHGESEASIEPYTDDNLRQLHDYVRRFLGEDKTIHFTALLTRSLINADSQRDIVRRTKRVLKQSTDHFSNIPINHEGTFLGTSIAKIIREHDDYVAYFVLPLQRQKRAQEATSVAQLTLSMTDVILLLFCASGQDRTGLIVAMLMIRLFAMVCQQHTIPMTVEQATERYLCGGNPAFIASFSCPGSMGIKPQTNPAIFPKHIGTSVFSRISKTNKKSAISNKVALSHIEKRFVPDFKTVFMTQLTLYLALSAGPFGGLLIFQSYQLRNQKRRMVHACLDALSHSQSLLDCKDAIKKLAEAHQASLLAKRQSFFFRHIRDGRLGKIIETIEKNTPIMQQPV
ncbi:MAG: hypothetical protein A3F41_04900 [Coxiella sp. RIFCSPHIGHO2_12_FULL_44_14]|nr:MAG: hypothetical protein A3F41_04900 [Coxiella sp. RIFCSPHIGHO2_12_FULL_44_14]